MKYYFSSPGCRLKYLFDCKVKRFLFSFAVDASSINNHIDKLEDVIIDSGAFTLWNRGGGNRY